MEISTMRSPLLLSSFILLIAVYSGCLSARTEKPMVSAVSDARKGNVSAGQNDPQEEKNGAGTEEKSMPTDEGSLFSGTFSVNMTGYRGTLTLSVKNGNVEGTIFFPDWGNGEPQVLHDVHVNTKDRNIYFIRSVTTEEEMKKTGSGRFFTQVYRGVFSPDWKKIRGVYTDAGADYSWQAER